MGVSWVMGYVLIEVLLFKFGVLVIYFKFGEGMVIDYEGSGVYVCVQVEFVDVGSKWLVMVYVNLMVI